MRDRDPSRGPRRRRPRAPSRPMHEAHRARGERKPTMTDVARVAGRLADERLADSQSHGRRADLGRRRASASFEAAREIGYELPGARRPYSALRASNVYRLSRRRNLDQPASGRQPRRRARRRLGERISRRRACHAFEPRTGSRDDRGDPPAIRIVIGVIYSTIFTRRVSPADELSGLPTVLLNCHGARPALARDRAGRSRRRVHRDPPSHRQGA